MAAVTLLSSGVTLAATGGAGGALLRAFLRTGASARGLEERDDDARDEDLEDSSGEDSCDIAGTVDQHNGHDPMMIHRRLPVLSRIKAARAGSEIVRLLGLRLPPLDGVRRHLLETVQILGDVFGELGQLVLQHALGFFCAPCLVQRHHVGGSVVEHLVVAGQRGEAWETA